MLSSGISCLILTPLCFIADHKGHGQFLLPFKAMGVSPLILYYFSSLAGNLSVKVMVSEGSSGLIVPVKHRLFYATFGYVAGPAGSLLYSLMSLFIFIIFALIIMHAKQRLTAGLIVPVPQGELPSSSQ
jgi:predicted acyltransferase